MSDPFDLLVVADYADGGLGMAAANHARHYAQQGWRVALAAPQATRLRDVSTAVLVDLPVPDSGRALGAMRDVSRQLKRLLHEWTPRHVHAHGLRSLALCRLAGVKPFLTFHSLGPLPGQSRGHYAARLLVRTLAPYAARAALSVAPVRGHWTVAPMASPRLRGLSTLPMQNIAPVPTFLWLGRLTAQKRPDVFVRAVGRAAQEKDLRGVIVGDGELADNVRRLVLELQAPIDIVGHTDDVSPHLASAWAWCLFSRYEGIPFAMQEAMWAGRACVVTPLPQLRWFGAADVLYAEEVEDAAEALVKLCDPDLAAHYGALAARRVRALLDPDAPFPVLDALYGYVDD